MARADSCAPCASFDEARAVGSRALLAFRRGWQAAPGHAAALEGLACVSVARGDSTEAARLLGAAEAWRQRRHRPADRLDRDDVEHAEQAARGVLGDSEFDEVHRAGAARSEAVLGDAGQLAL